MFPVVMWLFNQILCRGRLRPLTKLYLITWKKKQQKKKKNSTIFNKRSSFVASQWLCSIHEEENNLDLVEQRVWLHPEFSFFQKSYFSSMVQIMEETLFFFTSCSIQILTLKFSVSQHNKRAAQTEILPVKANNLPIAAL